MLIPFFGLVAGGIVAIEPQRDSENTLPTCLLPPPIADERIRVHPRCHGQWILVRAKL
jgi:hypothetical protein